MGVGGGGWGVGGGGVARDRVAGSEKTHPAPDNLDRSVSPGQRSVSKVQHKQIRNSVDDL